MSNVTKDFEKRWRYRYKIEIIQLSFDILGELIKFNRANFYILSYYLADSKEMNEFIENMKIY